MPNVTEGFLGSGPDGRPVGLSVMMWLGSRWWAVLCLALKLGSDGFGTFMQALCLKRGH